MQLDLFQHALRYYYEAVARLEALDLSGCRALVETHRAAFPRGQDIGPVAEAADWLEDEIPGVGADAQRFGGKCLRLCRALRKGEVGLPPLLSGGAAVAAAVAKTLAARAVGVMKNRGMAPSAPLSEGLPWGAFCVIAGRWEEGRTGLAAYLAGSAEPSAAALLALGEASERLGHAYRARCAWRDGYGLDPDGAGWAPEPPPVADVRARFADDPLFSGPWWVVGAYLEGFFPRFGRAQPAAAARRWRRFAREDAPGPIAPEAAPARFFKGLFLSEQGAALPLTDLARVRRTLGALHPEAYRMHREQLEEGTSP